MGGSKKRPAGSEAQSMIANDRQAENNTAASTAENRNQKGHVPNSPSTG